MVASVSHEYLFFRHEVSFNIRCLPKMSWNQSVSIQLSGRSSAQYDLSVGFILVLHADKSLPRMELVQIPQNAEGGRQSSRLLQLTISIGKWYNEGLCYTVILLYIEIFDGSIMIEWRRRRGDCDSHLHSK